MILLLLPFLACGSPAPSGPAGRDGDPGWPGQDGTAPDEDGDGVNALHDCDDTDPGVRAGDDHYIDLDADGFGHPLVALRLCAPEPGWVPNDLDCDDQDPRVSPEAAERCDGVDNDCDALVDAADSSLDSALEGYLDADGDGFGTGAWGPACATDAVEVGDCDDADADVHPAATEVCADGVDNDCDGTGNGCGLPSETPWTEGVVFASEDPGDAAGRALAALDLTGDGLLDLVVGAPLGSEGEPLSGTVFVIEGPVAEGPADGGSLYDHTVITGHTDNSFLGFGLADAGDLDGDGVADLLVGTAYGEDAWLIYGGPLASGDVSALADVHFAGRNGLELGTGVAAAPGGVFIGQYEGANGAGAAHLFTHFEGTTRTDDADAVFEGEAPGDRFGTYTTSHAHADYDGDGVADLVFSARGADRVYAFTGGAGSYAGTVAAADADLILEGEGEFGLLVAAVGDWDDDGLPNLFVGAPGVDTAWVYAGDAVLLQLTGASRLGTSAAGDDLDEDGVVDLVLGASGYEGGGALWFVPGEPGAAQQSRALGAPAVVGDDADDEVGHRQNPLVLGDLTGDGLPDLAGGAPGADSVFLFAGGSL